MILFCELLERNRSPVLIILVRFAPKIIRTRDLARSWFLSKNIILASLEIFLTKTYFARFDSSLVLQKLKAPMLSHRDLRFCGEESAPSSKQNLRPAGLDFVKNS